MKNEKKATPRNKLVLQTETIREIRVKSSVRTGRGGATSLKLDQAVGCAGLTPFCTQQ